MTKRSPLVPLPLLALTVGAFGIGVTEFILMGLLIPVSASFNVSISTAGLLISGYALGVVLGAPVMTIATARWPHKRALLTLMGIFILGNVACAIAPSYGLLLAARVFTAFAHGAFFGVGSVVATGLVPPQRRASAIAVMFTGLTVANILGVPFGTWIGQHAGWRTTFWAVSLVGVLALAAIAWAVPPDHGGDASSNWRTDLRMLAQRRVALGLTTTVLGYAGVFALFTYIAPLLTRIAGFHDTAISPILLLFGCGLVLGNFAGGWLADKALAPAIFAVLALLFVVLLAAGPLMTVKAGALVAITGLGFAGFATVAPLQTWVLRSAEGAGASLASSFNIAAFNLGNAIGAWAGGVALDGWGLSSVTWVAALFPAAALGVALVATRIPAAPQELAE